MMPTVRARILNARNRLVPSDVAHDVSDSLDIGDWWVIYMLGRNLDPIIFRDVMLELSADVVIKKKRRR